VWRKLQRGEIRGLRLFVIKKTAKITQLKQEGRLVQRSRSCRPPNLIIRLSFVTNISAFLNENLWSIGNDEKPTRNCTSDIQ